MSWREMYNCLKSDIELGVLAQGEVLPTQGELSERFQVSRHAVRRALGALQKEGTVVSWQGKGTFVNTKPIEHQINERPRLRTDAAAQGYELSIEPVGGSLRRMPPEVCGLLKASNLAEILVGERLVRLNGQEVQLVRHFFDKLRFEGILEVLERTGSVRSALSEFGVQDYQRTATRIMARRPTAHEAAVLAISPTQPVVAMTIGNVASDGKPVVATQTVSRGDRMHLVV